MHEVPVEQENCVTAPVEEVNALKDHTDKEKSFALSEKEKVDREHTAEGRQSVEEEIHEEEASKEAIV